MINLQAGSLLAPIVQATQLGNLDWQEDPIAGFMVILGDNTVSLYEADRVFPNGSRRETYILRALNQQNKVVDFVEYDETDSSFQTVKSLHALIRRQVFKADTILSDIMERLNTAH